MIPTRFRLRLGNAAALLLILSCSGCATAFNDSIEIPSSRSGQRIVVGQKQGFWIASRTIWIMDGSTKSRCQIKMAVAR